MIRYRVHVEIEWLLAMAEQEEISIVRNFSEEERLLLRSWVAEFNDLQANLVKEIEHKTRHDVKAVEYYLKKRLESTSLKDVREGVHFCCTSEDINNLAYALMLKEGIEREWLPVAKRLIDSVTALAVETRNLPLLTRTHGQPASPSTLGKELAVFVYRWKRQVMQLEQAEYMGKFNGTVGSYNVHMISYPGASWENISRSFVEGLGLTFNPLSTQIEPHDYMAELFHNLTRFNNITIDFDRDMWSYISFGYFRQKVVTTEAGSSVMPHKVNPIDFENSEANLGISNALLDHLASKLAISRLQRDLSDSSALRNIGTALGNSMVGLYSTLNGLERAEVNAKAMQEELENAWEVLAEVVQTIMRKAGYKDPYEIMKERTRGIGIKKDEMQAFIRDVDLPQEDKDRLLALTPALYTGLSNALVEHILG